MIVETILIPSCRAAVLIGGLFVLRWCLGNRISPTMRHAFWGLVPLALLPVAISSPVSLYNLSDYAGFCGGFLFGTADVATSRFSNQSSA